MNLAYIQYTDNVPAPHGAITVGPWVRILPKYKDDVGLLAHELVHVEQFWFGVLAFLVWLPVLKLYVAPETALMLLAGGCAIAFALRKRLKLMAEVDAYRVQLQYDKGNKWLFATYISARYGLDITTERAIELLTN